MKKQTSTILKSSLSVPLVMIVSLSLIFALTISIVAFLFIAIASPIVLLGILPIMHTDHFLHQELKSEVANYPPVFVQGTVYAEEEKYEVNKIVKEQNEDYLLSEVLYVSIDCIYIVVATKDDVENSQTYTWMVASIDKETLSYVELFRINGCSYWHRLTKEGQPYDQRSSYYYDGYIVLNTGETVCEYSIFDDTVKHYSPNEYEFPAYTVAGEVIDHETVSILIDGTIKTYTLSDIASESPAVSKIYELKDKKTINAESPINDFFMSVSWVNNDIYVICNIQAFSGDLFAVILKYDQQNDTWLYCTGCHMGGYTTVYLIPYSG